MLSSLYEYLFIPYFSDVTDPRVSGRCLHLLPDILLIDLCTYLTGDSDYQDVCLFGLERGSDLAALLSLPNSVPNEDTFEHVFKGICPEELEDSLRIYGKSILSDLSQKQLIIDGKKQHGVSPTTRGNRGLCLLNVRVNENRFCIAQEEVQDKSNEITAIPLVLNDMIRCFHLCHGYAARNSRANSREERTLFVSFKFLSKEFI